jgi:outer membrane biogenesis lipoprotein LolB
MKTLKIATFAVLALFALTACSSDADVASQNLSQDADQFKIARRVVFLNGITDKYILSVKLPNGQYIKHSEGLSDNVTWFSQQLDGVDVSTVQYRLIFKPEVLLPNITR